MLVVHSYDFFQKPHKFVLGVRPLDMTPVQQLGDDRWWVVCAALCHMALVFAIKHLYLILYYIHPFLFYTFNLVSIN